MWHSLIDSFWFPFVLTGLGAFGAAIAPFLSDVNRSKAKTLSILAAAVVFVGAIIFGIQQDGFQKRSETDQKMIQAKTEKIIELQNQSLNALNGGDSYPYATFIFDNDKNEATMTVHVNGKDGLRALSIQICNQTLRRIAEGQIHYRVTPENETLMAATIREENIGDLAPSTEHDLAPIKLDLAFRRFDYEIRFHASNGVFVQNIKIIRIMRLYDDNKWMWTYDSELSTESGKPLREVVDSWYPRNKDGSPNDDTTVVDRPAGM